MSACGALRADALDGLPLLEDLPPVGGRRVLVRVDFNVPLRRAPRTGRLEVADDFRIRASRPTLEWLQQRGAEVTACTHLGRPHGHPEAQYEVAPVRARLGRVVPGVSLLENLRFDPGEEANDKAFVQWLVDDFDCYVNDAFGASHRAHASIVGPPAHLPSAAGRVLQREVEVLGGLRLDPARPFVAVVGGAKVSDKLGVLHSLLQRVDRLVVGGGMAFTFLAALGHPIGTSLLDPAALGSCRAMLEQAHDRIVLPGDSVVIGPGDEVRTTGADIPDGWQGRDIGPESRARFAQTVLEAGTVFWNGPMGVFEDARFSTGTRVVAQAVADSAAFTVVGGGDTAAALKEFGVVSRVDFVSTGGGASLELLERGDLPGLEALRAAVNAPRLRPDDT
jgi:phosphoglycerate kinase